MAAAASSSSQAATSGEERRGIPAAAFVEDVETYLSQSGLDVNASLSLLQERLQQYKIVEMKLLAQQRDLQAFHISSPPITPPLSHIHIHFHFHFHFHFNSLILPFFSCIFQAKIPDILKCLDIVATLQSKKGSGEVSFILFSFPSYNNILLDFVYFYNNDPCYINSP